MPVTEHKVTSSNVLFVRTTAQSVTSVINDLKMQWIKQLFVLSKGTLFMLKPQRIITGLCSYSLFISASFSSLFLCSGSKLHCFGSASPLSSASFPFFSCKAQINPLYTSCMAPHGSQTKLATSW